jgi:hypothetical protein
MEAVLANAFIEEVPDEETSIPDVYETYLNNLVPGENTIPLNVTEESYALPLIMLTIDKKEYIKGIVDPGSQIIAMSKGVCHDIGLRYDPSIKLNMQSVNGDVDQSLGLVQNVPCRIGTITLYLQIHVIRSPAYEILLGQPFDVLTESTIKNFTNEDQTITMLTVRPVLYTEDEAIVHHNSL